MPGFIGGQISGIQICTRGLLSKSYILASRETYTARTFLQASANTRNRMCSISPVLHVPVVQGLPEFCMCVQPCSRRPVFGYLCIVYVVSSIGVSGFIVCQRTSLFRIFVLRISLAVCGPS